MADSVTEIQLTESQATALDYMSKWFNDEELVGVNTPDCMIDPSNRRTFVLSGSAGTGKSTLTKFFIEAFPYRKIAVSAPTHKAKKVINTITGKDGYTLQKLLGLKPNLDLEDFNPNNPIFAQQFEPAIKDFELVLIDECSMINAELYDMLLNQAEYHSTKLLFIGDELQLPPVNEHISKSFKGTNFIRLTEVIRQANTNPLLELLARLRDDMLNNTDTFYPYLKEVGSIVNDNGNGFVTMNRAAFCEELIEKYQEAFRNDYVRLAAWTNKSVGSFNTYVRNQLYPDSKLPINEGEVLLSYNSVAEEDAYGNLNVILINSEDYRVETITPASTPDGIEYFLCDIRAIDYNHTKRVRIVNPYDTGTFDEIHARYLETAKAKRAWRKYYGFKNNYLVFGNFVGQESGYIKKDLDYSYGITVHKTQGSTYNYIFVNGTDIERCRKRLDRLKLWYVALSRARYTAYITI